MKAVVVGGTGATGREVIAQLLQNPKWERVISIARREVDLPKELKNAFGAKLQQHIINMDNLAAAGQGAFEKADVVFCTLGTTRSKAGSAANFKRVDLGYVTETAKLAKEANVPHFSLLTAQGANAKIWASDIGIFHALLYARIKGEAEEAVKLQGFQRVSIFRPGLLDRLVEKRSLERLASSLVSSITVSDLAQCMILDAERPGQGVQTFNMKQLLTASKAKKAPEN